MKKFIAITALALLSFGAQAAGTYVLTNVEAFNPFTQGGTSPLTLLGGTATVDGGGNVTTAGVGFSLVNPNATFTYTNGAWTTTVGGTSLTGTGTCVEGPGTACSSPVSGYLAAAGGTTFFGTGIQNDGVTPSSAVPCPAGFFPAGPCDWLSVTEVGSGANIGDTLIIMEQSTFAFPGAASGNIWTFTVVPIPAAVWLFGSALGLLGFARRRKA